MPYKLCWKRANSEKICSGPILGKVLEDTFVPLSRKEAFEKALFVEKTYRCGNTFLCETLFTKEDIPELRKIHPRFSDVLNVSEETENTLKPRYFQPNGEELLFLFTEDFFLWDQKQRLLEGEEEKDYYDIETEEEEEEILNDLLTEIKGRKWKESL